VRDSRQHNPEVEWTLHDLLPDSAAGERFLALLTEATDAWRGESG
jgi:hypothetical protein